MISIRISNSEYKFTHRSNMALDLLLVLELLLFPLVPWPVSVPRSFEEVLRWFCRRSLLGPARESEVDCLRGVVLPGARELEG